MYTLDTNAIIYHLKGDLAVGKRMEEIYALGSPIYVSTVTEVELFSYSLLTAEETGQTASYLTTVSIMPLDSQIARIAGAIRKEYGVETADSVIAATALFTGSVLLTRNIRDFRNIATLQLEAI